MSTEQLYERIMKVVSPRDKYRNVLMPSDEQKKVIICDKPAIRVVAGAGSGKTRTMTNRIAYWIGTGSISPSEVLGLTFTNKAANELAERVAQSLKVLHSPNVMGGRDATSESEDSTQEYLLERPTIRTYNSFASDIVSQYALLIGENPQARLITNAERYQLMTEVVDAMSYEEISQFDSAPSAIIKDTLELSANLIDNGVSIEKARQFFQQSSDVMEWIHEKYAQAEEKFMGEKPNKKYNGTAWNRDYGWESGLAPYWTDRLRSKAPNRLKEGLASLDLVECYWALKRERALIEFADQIDMAVRILSEHPHLCREISSRYRLVLLDEYQDTSVRQAHMLALALAEPSGEGENWRSVCVVGDPNQAIYGFRGASANAFEDFNHLFESLGAREDFSLETTYRNDKAILEAANAVAGTIEKGSIDVRPLQARVDAGAGKVIQIRPLRREDSYRAAALRIRDKMREVREEELKKHTDNPGHRIRGAEIAVLCRERKSFSAISAALDELNVPYEIVGGTSLFERPEILNVRAALVAATNPNRLDTFARLFAYLNLGLDDIRAISAVLSRKKKNESQDDNRPSDVIDILARLNHIDCGNLSEEAKRRLIWLSGVLRHIQDMHNLPLVDIIHTAIDDLGIYVATASRTEGAQRVSTSLDLFTRMGGEYQRDHKGAGLRDFLEWIDFVIEKDNAQESQAGEDLDISDEDVEVTPGIVQIMTIHSAKGLEWRDLVVVPEMVHSEFSDETSSQFWQADKNIFPYPLRADKNYLPSFTFAKPKDSDYPLPEEGKKCPTLENSPHYPMCCALKKFDEEELHYECQEARRLAYVAFTRVQDELLLAGYGINNVRSALYHGANKRKKPAIKQSSTFLRNVAFDNIGDIAGASWNEEFGEGISQRLCYICPEEMDHDEFMGLLDESELLQLSSVKQENPQESTIEVEAWDVGQTYPQGLGRSLGQLLSYDDNSACDEIDKLTHEAHLLLAEMQEKAMGVDKVQSARPYLTATDVVNAAHDVGTFSDNRLRPIPHEPSEKARIGTQVHQKIADSYLVAPTIDLDMDEEVSNPREEIIARFFNAYAQSKWANFQPLHIESPVSLAIEGHVFRCTIDVVLDTSSDLSLPPITIVDWKTGAVPSGSKLHERQLQLALYRIACAKAWGYELDDIGVFFVYLNEEGKIQEIEAEAMSEEEFIQRISPSLSL